jgi:hypothetical protein
MSEREPPDPFEAILRDSIQERSQPSERDLAALDRSARAMPARPHSSMWRPLAAAAVVMAVVGGASLGLSRYWLGATSTDTPEASATATIAPTQSLSTAPATPDSSFPDPATWASDSRVNSCLAGATEETVILTAYQLAHASDYRQRLPSLGFRPELELNEPVLVVIFRGVSPVESPLQLGVSRSVHQPAPGTRDICIAGGDWHRRYVDVVLDFDYLAGTKTPPPGPVSRILGELPLFYQLQGTNLVWDDTGQAVWYAFIGCGEASTVYRWDAGTEQTEHWSIPSNRLGNCQTARAQLDDSGALWIMESSLLVRFDTRTHVAKSVRVAPDNDMSPTAPTALAVDGTSVLVARAETAKLTRVDEKMHVSTIAIPAGLEGASSLAVGRDTIYLLAGTKLNLLALDGTLRTTSDLPGDWLAVRPDGSVALWQAAGKWQVVDPSGAAGEIVASPAATSADQVTDWNGRLWYVGSTTRPVLIEVRTD